MSPNDCCSFCKKPRKTVARLIGGPGPVFICDECVRLIYRLLSEEEGAAGQPRYSDAKSAITILRGSLHCALQQLDQHGEELEQGDLESDALHEIKAHINGARQAWEDLFKALHPELDKSAE